MNREQSARLSIRHALYALALFTACRSPTSNDKEVEFVGMLEGTARTEAGAPLDSVRVLPVGAADEAIYAFVQTFTGADGRFAVTVFRKGDVGNANQLTLTVNVIATAFKGYNDMPDGPFPTKHLTVPMQFVPSTVKPAPAHVDITF